MDCCFLEQVVPDCLHNLHIAVIAVGADILNLFLGLGQPVLNGTGPSSC